MALEIDILTLYPNMFASPCAEAVIRRAIDREALRIYTHQIRDFAEGKHHSVDDTPFGGGSGMLLRFDVLYRAWKHAQERNPSVRAHTIFLSPQGTPFCQKRAVDLSRKVDRLLLVCGRFEGVDERFIETCVDEELSVGDYVTSGGEMPALVVIDTVARLLPGVLGNAQSVQHESFSASDELLLEGPQYTQPREFMERSVPAVLLSGNHAEIAVWRRKMAEAHTAARRPDLMKKLVNKKGET